MNEDFAQWLYNRAFYILTHPNDFTDYQRRCAQEVEEWYAEQYCTPDDTFPRYIPDGAIEVVCQAFDFEDCFWEEPDFGHDKMEGYKPVHVYINDWYEYQADILADLEELRAAGDCELADDLDQEQDEYHSLRDCDHDLDADLTYYERAGVL